MADQREITLYPGDATPKDIVLRSLPAATVPAGTTIYLYQGDATPNDPILRDPTTVSVTGPQSYELIAGGGSYTLTGQVASLLVGRLVGATSGAFSLTVDAAGLEYGWTLNNYTLTADGAEYSAAFGDANMGHAQIQGGAKYGQYGAIDFWLRPKESEDEEKEVAAPKKAVQIIKRVAEKQAERGEFNLAPLKVAFQRASYKYQPNYADIYRRVYEAALVRLRQETEDDDEEAILMLM